MRAYRADAVRRSLNICLDEILEARKLINMDADSTAACYERLCEAQTQLGQVVSEVQRLREQPDLEWPPQCVTSTGDKTDTHLFR